jgi:hypothetical protein
VYGADRRYAGSAAAAHDEARDHGGRQQREATGEEPGPAPGDGAQQHRSGAVREVERGVLLENPALKLLQRPSGLEPRPRQALAGRAGSPRARRPADPRDRERASAGPCSRSRSGCSRTRASSSSVTRPWQPSASSASAALSFSSAARHIASIEDRRAPARQAARSPPGRARSRPGRARNRRLGSARSLPRLLAQLRDVHLDALDRGRRRPLAPQRIDEPLGRDDSATAQTSIASRARCLCRPSATGRSPSWTSSGPRMQNRRSSPALLAHPRTYYDAGRPWDGLRGPTISPSPTAQPSRLPRSPRRVPSARPLGRQPWRRARWLQLCHRAAGPTPCRTRGRRRAHDIKPNA